MTFAKIHKDTLLSFLIIGLLTLFVFIASKPTDEAPIENWWLVVFCIVTLFIAIIAGLIFIALRLFKVLKNTAKFFYNFIGTINLYLGLISLTYIIMTKPKMFDQTWIAIFAINFLIGLLIIIDVYKRNNKPYY